jgi:hypothetical protein
MKLGIDIGRVLISPDPAGGGDTSFIGGSIQAALATPPYEGMFEAVPQLARMFGGRVWLVSKARPKMQEKTRLWLAHHRFFERAGIASDQLRFCLERPQKAEHCRELALEYFIDDRLDVLEHLEGVVPQRFLFGPQKEGLRVPPGITPVADWPAALAAVAARLPVQA